MAAPCREALARRASQSTVSCGQPSAGISVEEFLYLFSHTNRDSFLRPLSFYSRGAMLGETGIDTRNKDLLPPLEKAQNVARISIEIEDLTGKSNPNLEGVLYSTFSGLAALFCQSSQQSSQPVFCRLSEITDDSCSDTSKKTPKSGEERSTCCCGRVVELGEPEKP